MSVKVTLLPQDHYRFVDEVDHDRFFQRFPSIQKRTANSRNGFYPHASKDPAELRYEFLKLMGSSLDFSTQIVVGRKIPSIFIHKHQCQGRAFYADLMSQLMKTSYEVNPLIMNVAVRGSATSNKNLQDAVRLAHARSLRGSSTIELRNTITFNVQPYDRELLLSLADYSLWTVQRVYERGDDKYLLLLDPKINLVLDVYDDSRYQGAKNYYTPKYNPLTAQAIGFDEWQQPFWPL